MVKTKITVVLVVVGKGKAKVKKKVFRIVKLFLIAIIVFNLVSVVLTVEELAIYSKGLLIFLLRVIKFINKFKK